MDAYHIALFLHIVTLIVAACVTAVVKLAIGRRARARTIGEALDWHGVMLSAAKIFPICLALFVITGGYMLSLTQVHVWSTGFVVAGLVGVVLLLVSGIYLGTQGRALTNVLNGMAKGGLDQPVPRMVPPAPVVMLPVVNTGIALAVVFDMVTKPASVTTALAIVAAGIILSAAASMRRPAPAAETVEAAEAATAG
jgi:hypothetical protein